MVKEDVVVVVEYWILLSYTQYYLAIERNEIGSLVQIWMDLETTNGNPLQCSCLENPRDGGAWWAAVYGVAWSRTWLKRPGSSSRDCHIEWNQNEKKRHWYINQSYGLCGRGRGRGWGDLGEWHWNMYNMYEMSRQSRFDARYLDAWGWCTGTTQRDGMGREEGGGFRMGNTCIPVADSFWCLTKLIQYCKV